MSETSKINLAKQAVINLQKEKGFEGQKSKVMLCLDYSGSMADLYRKGFVQRVLERIIPIALAMDDDAEMEVYAFHNQCFRILPNVTTALIRDYVKDYIASKHSFSGTSYAPAFSMILDQFLRDTDNMTVEVVTTGGWFNKKTTQVSKAKIPGFCVMITDGENDDKDAAREAIIKASNHALAFCIIGLDSDNCRFQFLNAIDTMDGRKVDNITFFQMTEDMMSNCEDKELYSLIFKEYVPWLKETLDLGMRDDTPIVAELTTA